jgi:SNF2 family DNA or RNA helicase
MLSLDKLHSYQRFGVKHVLENPSAGLFLDMGLGKTITTLTAIEELIGSLEVSRVLVVGPKRVVESVWTQEAAKWRHTAGLTFSLVTGDVKKRKAALEAEADVYLVGRDVVPWLCEQYGGSFLPFDMLVLDELSSFKNHQSQRFKALKRVRKSIGRVVGLTGTPAPNGLIDLWAQLFLLDGGERLGHSIGGYRTTYFNPGQTKGGMVYNYRLKGESAQTQIYRAIGDICVSMKAEDYLDMPEKILIDERVALGEKTTTAYKEFEKELVLNVLSELGEKEISVATAAALSTKLLQFANGALYDEDRNVHAVHDLKLDKLEDIVEAANGRPVLVAISFRHDATRILKRFAAMKPRVLDGQKDIDDFNAGKVQMLILHPASGGHGLNIQHGSNYVIWFGLNWSLELYKQLIARLWRQGQKAEQVFVYRIIAAGTIDERVISSLEAKDEAEGELLGAVKVKSGMIESIKELLNIYKDGN